MGVSEQNRSIQDTIQGDDSEGTKFQKLFDSANKRHETSLQIENKYKKQQPPIGVFMGWTGRNAIDVWDLLINKPDLGIRCCTGSAEERTQALAFLNDPKPKLVADLISLTTLYCLGAADTVDKVFGKLCIAQSTIDELLQIIHEKEGMSIEKQDKRYVRHTINPKDIGRNVELPGLTSGRDTHTVLRQLEYLIQNKRTLFCPVENRILRQIEAYEQIYPFERNFDFLSEDDIRIKGTRIGIETVLYESLHLSQTPEEIVENYPTLTLEEVYATILYYLQNPIKIGSYLADKLQFSQILREESEKNPPPGVVRLRQLQTERQAGSDDSHMNIPKSSQV